MTKYLSAISFRTSKQIFLSRFVYFDKLGCIYLSLRVASAALTTAAPGAFTMAFVAANLEYSFAVLEQSIWMMKGWSLLTHQLGLETKTTQCSYSQKEVYESVFDGCWKRAASLILLKTSVVLKRRVSSIALNKHYQKSPTPRRDALASTRFENDESENHVYRIFVWEKNVCMRSYSIVLKLDSPVHMWEMR